MISIMTWNTALSEDDSSKTEIFDYIKNFLEKENSLAVLQQIPYRDPENNYLEFQAYLDFKRNFPENEYTNKYSEKYKNGFYRMVTVIVTKKENAIKISRKTTNRECAVFFENSYYLFGIHARNGIDNKKYLEDLNEIDDDIILGDFNAGDYEKCTNNNIFRSILENYVCICNIPTKEVKEKGKVVRRTCIDHVFVKRKIVDKCSNLIVHEDIRFSDHYPITFDILD